MASAATVRQQVEAALAQRIPAALTPAEKVRSAVHATGIGALDGLLGGGLPEGALSELVGPECSGRTAAALSFVAQRTREGKVCAWIDVSDALDPVSAAAAGVDLKRLLWVRCGVTGEAAPKREFLFQVPAEYFAPPAVKRGLYGGGRGGHPRGEVKGLSQAVDGLLGEAAVRGGRCAEPMRKQRKAQAPVEPVAEQLKSQKRDMGRPAETTPKTKYRGPSASPQDDGLRRESALPQAKAGDRDVRSRWKGDAKKPWGRMEQAMRAADLLLQAGGFAAVVIDMGGLAPEFCLRVPLATWFRYRAAAERTRTSVLLLTQVACAKSSAEVVLRMQGAEEILAEPTLFAGMQPGAEIARQRFAKEAKVVPIRKAALHAADALRAGSWWSRTVWAPLHANVALHAAAALYAVRAPAVEEQVEVGGGKGLKALPGRAFAGSFGFGSQASLRSG